MKLSKALAQIKDPTIWDVRFYEKQDTGSDTDIHTTTANLDTLYFDWMGDCVNCPENGTYIYGLLFANIVTGHVFMVDNTPEEPETLTFEQLMENIGNHFYAGKRGGRV